LQIVHFIYPIYMLSFNSKNSNIIIIYSFVLLLNFTTFFAKAQSPSVPEQVLKLKINDAKTDTSKARLMGQLAWLYKISDPKACIALTEQELQIAYKNNASILLADAYRMKSLQLVIAKKYAQGEACYDSCIKYAQLANSDYYQASCYSMWAGMYGVFTDYDKSVELYEKGLDFAKKSKDTNIIAVLSNNVAAIYKTSGIKKEQANAMLMQAKDNFILIKKWQNASMISSNLAVAYADNKAIQKCLAEIKSSQQLLQKDTTDIFFNAQAYNNYAYSFLACNKIDSAKLYALASKAILEKLNVPDNLMTTIETLTSIYVANNEIAEAEKYANYYLKLAKEQGSKLGISKAYKFLSDIASKNNNAPLALDYYKQHKAWSDSAFNMQREETLKNLEAKSLKIKTELETQLNTKALQQTNSVLGEQKSNLILVVFSLLSMGLISLYAYIKSKKLNKALVHEKQIVEKQSAEKAVLISEIHHRVKNNLTMLKSLLYLQSKAAIEPETKRILQESQNRIQSMALVHQQLYDSENNVKINFTNFIKELYEELCNTYRQNDIAIHVHGTPTPIDINLAIPLALIMNELATNSLKYAFSSVENGKINTAIVQQNNKIKIVYSDNGPGLAKDFDLGKGGFGFKVLNILCQQINASITYNKNEFCEFIITLNLH
jgi:two-component system, sensor histidine kinase PdtaS